MNEKKLNLGWCQGYMALQYHYEEACLEKSISFKNITPSPKYAIFSNKYYKEIKSLNKTKIFDFCFIGSLESGGKDRIWVIEFIKKYFTENSIFINTDCPIDWISLGIFDYTNIMFGFCPKKQTNNQTKIVQYRNVKDNELYFGFMRCSKYCLCPAGDAPWSFRFYEILMCESIPLVDSWHHTYRTKEESKIKYKYVLYVPNQLNIYDMNIKHVNLITQYNTKLFKKYHLLNYLNIFL